MESFVFFFLSKDCKFAEVDSPKGGYFNEINGNLDDLTRSNASTIIPRVIISDSNEANATPNRNRLSWYRVSDESFLHMENICENMEQLSPFSRYDSGYETRMQDIRIVSSTPIACSTSFSSGESTLVNNLSTIREDLEEHVDEVLESGRNFDETLDEVNFMIEQGKRSGKSNATNIRLTMSPTRAKLLQQMGRNGDACKIYPN